MDLDEWSSRERLVLSHSVERFGTQNMGSTVRAMKKVFGEQRAYTAKDCAREYSRLLDEWAKVHAEPVTARKVAEEQSAARIWQLKSRIRAAETQLSLLCEAINGDEEALKKIVEQKTQVSE